MPKSGQRKAAAARPTTRRHGSGRRSQSSGAAADSEQRVLKHGQPTVHSEIGASLRTKAGNLAVICGETGDMDAPDAPAHGLFFHDTRYLDQAMLWINGRRPTLLLGSDSDGWRSRSALTNPDLPLANGGSLQKERLSIERTRELSDVVDETIVVRNFSHESVTIDLELAFAATFTDIFIIRGSAIGKRGKLHQPELHDGNLVFRYDGADGRTRTTALAFRPPPDHLHGGTVSYGLQLPPSQSATINVRMTVCDDGPGELETSPHVTRGDRVAFQGVHAESNLESFDRAIAQAFADLRMLLTHEHGDTYFAAGVPWYIALFGRDSLVAALETLAFDAAVARTTLQVLAKYQGTHEVRERDEQPGKILHEFRVGEKANLHEIPQYPYYGTVDATPLFIILAGEYVRWTADIQLWHDLRGAVENALQWIERYGDSDGDGFIDYHAVAGKGLVNQGWKDSGNSITNRDGTLAQPPIALVEVQGYVYRAWLSAAFLYEIDGDATRADELRRKAADLRARFALAFWMEDRAYLAVALGQDGKRAESLTSNPGQALWSGIVAHEHAPAIARTLLNDPMFSGWGIRTLAEGEAAYNPIDYQVGSIWPHDNALIAAGLRRYGHDAEALSVFSAIFAAATKFKHGRLPEVFAGFARKDYPDPVHYPVACLPQAWAAGALPYMLQTMLGLEPDAPHRLLRIVRPILPDWLENVTLHQLAVGGARCDLAFHREADRVSVVILQQQGELQIELQP